MMTPGLEPMIHEDAPDTLGRDAVHHLLGYQILRQLHTIPLRQTAAPQVGRLTRQLDEVECHAGLELRLAARAWLVFQPRQSPLPEALTPFVNMVGRHADLLRGI